MIQIVKNAILNLFKGTNPKQKVIAEEQVKEITRSKTFKLDDLDRPEEEQNSEDVFITND